MGSGKLGVCAILSDCWDEVCQVCPEDLKLSKFLILQLFSAGLVIFSIIHVVSVVWSDRAVQRCGCGGGGGAGCSITVSQSPALRRRL